MKSEHRFVLLAAAIVVAVLFPAYMTAQEAGPDIVHMQGGRLAGVTFNHAARATETECVTCHHESKPEMPATSEYGQCSSCHLDTVEAPMTTNRRDAFHDARATQGICIDCHTTDIAAGKTVPTRCRDCHRTENN